MGFKLKNTSADGTMLTYELIENQKLNELFKIIRQIRLIPHNKPTLGREEEEAALRVLRSDQLSQGSEVELFENGLKSTVQWYLDNPELLNNVSSTVLDPTPWKSSN